MIGSRNSKQANGIVGRRAAFRRTAVAAAVVAASWLSGPAAAFEFDTGNPDLAFRWDNTIRYNLGMRAKDQDPALLNNVNIDDGNRNFEKNSIVANRIDILSEIDLVWARSFGGRVSMAGWYDFAYRSLDGNSPQTQNTLCNGLPCVALSGYTERFAKGISGEVLDAFAFANFDLGNMPVNIRAGQTTVFWGDSLFGNGAVHGVSYSQNPLDLWKALATPGSEAKEIFRPRQGLTVQMQPTNDLSVAGQWFWDWKSVRYPESGSYLGFQDALLHGSDSLITGANPLAAAIPGSPVLARAWHQADADPRKNRDWGISARWSPDWLDGTLGFYYRRTADTQPQIVVKPGVAPLSAAFSATLCSAIGGTPFPPGPTPALCILPGGNTNVADLTQKGRIGNYNLAFGSDIKIYGVSLSKNLGGISFGSEISYRENMPLISDAVTALPTPLVNPALGQVSTSSLPANDTPGAKGNTWHGLVNALGVLPKTAFFDTMSYAAELTWMMVDKVTQNEAVYKGRAGYTAIDSASKTYFGLAVNLTPTWFQVIPGVDLLAPITWSQGLKGNSAVAAGGSENLGSWSVGLAVDIYNRYRIDLKYIGFFGDYSTNAANVATPIAVSGALVDRNFVNLTFKTTF